MLNVVLTPSGWFDGLPSSQSEAILRLIGAGKSEEEVGELWLSQTGSPNTAGFGVGVPIQSFYANVKREFVAFVCGDEKYKKEREQAAMIWNREGKVGLVSITAAVIASTVGLAAVAVVPVVALLFSSAAKIGLNAFCETCKSDAT